jgi:hypothetical protein
MCAEPTGCVFASVAPRGARHALVEAELRCPRVMQAPEQLITALTGNLTDPLFATRVKCRARHTYGLVAGGKH